MNKYININGELVQEDENSVSATSRAICYGDGCFETFVSYKGKFLHFGDHFNRLQHGLKYLEMQSPFSEENLKGEIHRLIEKCVLENENSVIRVQCYREGNTGYQNISDESSFIISTRPIIQKKSEISLKTVTIRAIPSQALERKVKLSNSINYIKAAQEAKKKGGNDALMLTMEEFISETTIANIFWIKGDDIYTPSINCDLLPGVTRSIIEKLIKGNPTLNLEQGKFSLQDIYEAEAVFCCNSVIELKAVISIDDTEYDTEHSILNALSKGFQSYKKEYSK